MLQVAERKPNDGLRSPARETSSGEEVNPHVACSAPDLSLTVEAANSSMPTTPQTNSVLRDDASKEVTTPAGTAIARPVTGLGFHPGTK
jgi:hypothetical protein